MASDGLRPMRHPEGGNPRRILAIVVKIFLFLIEPLMVFKSIDLKGTYWTNMSNMGHIIFDDICA